VKPYARYVFEKLFKAGTRYILREHSGVNIPDFPAIWKSPSHPHKGEKYIAFRETQAQRPGQRFTHALSLENNRMCTGLNFSLDFPQKSYGDFSNDAILIEFYVNRTWLILWFFEGIKMQSETLYNQWISGRLELK
jgi:hypothetical protein